MNSQVYITSNLLNGKIYIGQTNGKDPYYIGSGVFIRKAVKKYGKKSFRKEILIECSEQEVNFWEDFYIKLFDSRNPIVGYNMLAGGKNRSFCHTEQTIKKIKERSNQEDNKLRIREIQKMAVATNTGRKRNYQELLNIRNGRIGKERIIKVFDNSSGECVFSCNFVHEASDFTKVKPSNIKNNLYGLSKKTKLYTFKFKEVSHR